MACSRSQIRASENQQYVHVASLISRVRSEKIDLCPQSSATRIFLVKLDVCERWRIGHGGRKKSRAGLVLATIGLGFVRSPKR